MTVSVVAFEVRIYPRRCSHFMVADFGITNDSARKESVKMLQNLLAKHPTEYCLSADPASPVHQVRTESTTTNV
jgi:hypothetical protein